MHYPPPTPIPSKMFNDIDIIVQGVGADLSITFPKPIEIPENCDAGLGLKTFVTYNNMPNVSEGVNNSLLLKHPGSNQWMTLQLHTGAYEIAQLNNEIQEFLQLNYSKSKKNENVILIPNDSSMKCEIHILCEGYGISFNCAHSIHKLLGYNKTDNYERKGRYIPDNIVDIIQVSSLIFQTNVTESNYINNVSIPFIYSFPVNVPPGYRLQHHESTVAYKGLSTSQISTLRLWITDQSGSQIIDLRQDRLIVTLSLRIREKVKSVKIKE